MDEADVLQKARAFVASVDATNIRDDLFVYLQAANARLVQEDLGEGESGTTFTMPNGKRVITVNALENEVRQRFTVCHEIAHIVLDLPSVHQEVSPLAISKRDVNEIMCDIFAAELLMPYLQWRHLVSKEEPSISVIESMANQFKTSFPAAASRYAMLADIPCAFVTMDHGTIRHAARSTPLRHANAWIAPRSPIPIGSVAHRLRKEGASKSEAGEVDQDVWFQDWEKGRGMSEIGRHYRGFDTTISLLWFNEEDLPERRSKRSARRSEDDFLLPELTGELPWPGRRRRR